jgi:hypothetical protein
MPIVPADLSRAQSRDCNHNTNVCDIAATAKQRFHRLALRHFSFDQL